MSVAPGTRLGPYRIVVQIGEGGMGQVWRAADSSLGREVAIKVLPAAFAQDPERLARFEREARTLARLNHPNIAIVHGLERIPSTGSRTELALVMELVEGETLAERLAGGPLSPGEALPIARQIAQALDAAHDAGIIHRDLKPANIKVRPDGTVKVLDFGLAKTLDPAGADASIEALSRTVTSPATMTAAGMLLGTAAYMSPEQARGRPVDKRTDIWAFAVVLYEMLSGRRAFPGDDVTDTVASVVAREPDWALLPPGLPGVRACLVRCLQKDPRQRMRDIGDVLLALDGAFDTAPLDAASRAVPGTSNWRRMLPPFAAAAVTAIAMGLAAWKLWPIADVRSVTRFEYALPHGQILGPTQRPVVAVSPDGRYFVYQVADGLFLRAMDALEARRIDGTDTLAAGALDRMYNPFISPDGRWIGYFAGGQLKKIAPEGGTAVVLCAATTPYGAAWNRDNTILFGQPSGIMRVSANGGTPEVIIKAAEGEEMYGPQLLPGGDAVLFSVTTDRGPARWDRAHVVAQSLSSGKRTVVVDGSDARYLPTGHLVYAVRDTLFGISFDSTGLKTRGGPVPVVPRVQRSIGVAAVASNYGVSDQGTLVYLADSETPRSFVWVHRKDRRVESVAAIPPGTYADPRLSPDGRLLLTTRDGDIWIYELPSGRGRRLTQDGSSQMAVWDPKARQVAYSSAKGGNLEAWVVPSDGSGQPRQLTQLGGQVHVDSWSPDGRLLAIHHHRGSQPVDILVLPMDRPDAKPQVFVKGDFSAEGADFSSDMREAAYLSHESGQREIYVRPYPGPGGQQIVSVGGGREPVWAPNGDVFYRSLDGNRMFAVTVKRASTLQIGSPVLLFEGRYYVAPTGSPRRQYDVTADGQRILMLTSGNTGSGPTVVVVQNWFQELARAMSSVVQQ